MTINITHSAILESEDEEGYRMFIGEVAGGVQGPGAMHVHDQGQEAGVGLGYGLLGAGLGLGAGLEMQMGWSA